MIMAIVPWAKGCSYGIGNAFLSYPFVEGGDDPVPDYFTLRRNSDFFEEKEKAKAFLFSIFNILTMYAFWNEK